jgi:ATP-dependent Clp protease adaptor protein ClpS
MGAGSSARCFLILSLQTPRAMLKYYDEEVEVLDEVSVVAEQERELVVFNDDVNTFDHVIETLIKVCKHTPEQAEQCTLIIHFKGKCAVKLGGYEELVPMRDAICDRGISAEVM